LSSTRWSEGTSNTIARVLCNNRLANGAAIFRAQGSPAARHLWRHRPGGVRPIGFLVEVLCAPRRLLPARCQVGRSCRNHGRPALDPPDRARAMGRGGQRRASRAGSGDSLVRLGAHTSTGSEAAGSRQVSMQRRQRGASGDRADDLMLTGLYLRIADDTVPATQSGDDCRGLGVRRTTDHAGAAACACDNLQPSGRLSFGTAPVLTPLPATVTPF
jgi:hypothetical protein